MHSGIYNPDNPQRITTSLPVYPSCSSLAWHWWVTTAAGGSTWIKRSPTHYLKDGEQSMDGSYATQPLALSCWDSGFYISRCVMFQAVFASGRSTDCSSIPGLLTAQGSLLCWACLKDFSANSYPSRESDSTPSECWKRWSALLWPMLQQSPKCLDIVVCKTTYLILKNKISEIQSRQWKNMISRGFKLLVQSTQWGAGQMAQQLLLSQRTQVQLPEPTWRVTTVHNSSSRVFDAFFSPLWYPGLHVMHI